MTRDVASCVQLSIFSIGHSTGDMLVVPYPLTGMLRCTTFAAVASAAESSAASHLSS